MPEEIKKDVFPKNFMWGASTAAHQVEGHTHNQWSVWELMNAERLAKEAPNRIPNSGAYHKYSELPMWPQIKKQATDPQNYISGDGIEHYKRYKKDFDLVKELNLDSFRFTLEWSRIEP